MPPVLRRSLGTAIKRTNYKCQRNVKPPVKNKKTRFWKAIVPLAGGTFLLSTTSYLILEKWDSSSSSGMMDSLSSVSTILRVLWNKAQSSSVKEMSATVLANLSYDPSYKECLIASGALRTLLRILNDEYCNLDLIRGISNLSRVDRGLEELRRLKHASALLKILQFQGVHNTEDVEQLGNVLLKIVKNRNISAECPPSDVLLQNIKDLHEMCKVDAPNAFTIFALWGLTEIASQMTISTSVGQFLTSESLAKTINELSSIDGEKKFYAFKLLRKIIEKWVHSSLPLKDEVVSIWLNQIFQGLLDPNISTKKQAAYSLSALASDRRYIGRICKEPGVSILLEVARETHSRSHLDQNQVAKKENDHVRNRIVEIISKISETAEFASSYVFDKNAHTVMDPQLLKFLQSTNDVVDLPLNSAVGYFSPLYGWVDILVGWTSVEDDVIRKGAITALSNLVRYGKHGDLVLQQWMLNTLKAIRTKDPSPDIRRAVRDVEVTAESTNKNQKADLFVASEPVLETGFGALAVLAERHDTEILKQGGLELCMFMISRGNSDIKAQCLRVIANLAAVCCQRFDNGEDNVLNVGKLIEQLDGGKQLLDELKTWESIHHHSGLKFNLLRALENLNSLEERMTCSHSMKLDCKKDRKISKEKKQEDNNMSLRNVKETTTYPYYMEGVNLLHSDSSSVENSCDVDIVFVHGLRGNPITTWRCDHDANIIWPNSWLSSDLLKSSISSRILTLGYDAGLVTSSSPWPALTLKERAEVMLKSIDKALVGQRPVVFVTHSMGGLLVKEMIVLASEQEQYRSLLNNTRGVIFLAVPHTGAHIGKNANAEAIRKLVQAHPATKDLSSSAPHLLQLNRNFEKLTKDVDILSIGEGKPAPIGLGIETMVVLPQSANPGYGAFLQLLDSNHINVCKPIHPDDSRYSLVLKFIEKQLQHNPPEATTTENFS